MEQKEIIEKVNEMLAGRAKALDIGNVNHSLGHGYTLGSGHVSWVAQNRGGMLTSEAIDAYEKATGRGCAHPRCGESQSAHKSDRVVFLQLKCNLTNKEATDLFKPVAEFIEANKVDGFVFVESPEKYRITKD